MTLPRARIVRAGSPEGTRAAPLLPLAAPAPRRRRLAREELEARLEAERRLQAARAEAEALLVRAREEAAVAAAQIEREARERAVGEAAARLLGARAEEAGRLDRDADRIVAVAVVLAERLLGAALEIDPARVADLARVALSEVRGARRVVIEAHPLDAEVLGRHVGALGLGAHVVEARPAAGLARGELRLQTDGGIIDARLSVRLERLAAALRDAFPGQALLAD